MAADIGEAEELVEFVMQTAIGPHQELFLWWLAQVALRFIVAVV